MCLLIGLVVFVSPHHSFALYLHHQSEITAFSYVKFHFMPTSRQALAKLVSFCLSMCLRTFIFSLLFIFIFFFFFYWEGKCFCSWVRKCLLPDQRKRIHLLYWRTNYSSFTSCCCFTINALLTTFICMFSNMSLKTVAYMRAFPGSTTIIDLTNSQKFCLFPSILPENARGTQVLSLQESIRRGVTF